MAFIEKRRHPRVPVRIHFSGITQNSIQSFFLEDFSCGGLKLKVENKCEFDQKLSKSDSISIVLFYKIEHQFGEENIKVLSELKWSRSTSVGIVGVMFKNVSSEIQDKINKLVDIFGKNKIRKIDCIVEGS